MTYYITFILVQFIAVCWIWGFEYCFKDGEIFGGVGNYFRKYGWEWANKPLFDCKYCQSSIHGTLFFALFLAGEYSWWMWIIFCFGCCGMTAIFDKK